MITKKLVPFGTTVFAEMTALAQKHGAINLAQGFPDFEGPPEIVEAAVRALRSGDNQYARSRGHPPLVEAIAEAQRRYYGLVYDPMSEVVVFSGATEGIAASLLGILNPGDEVILFEPFYDSYTPCIAMAGALPRFLTLRFPDFALDADALRALVTDRTRMIVLNTPMNPTGKVFTQAELEIIASVCLENDLIALTDEVYEHLTFDEAKHKPLAGIPGMRERTLTLSSAGKSYSFTGWKVGWGTGPGKLVDAAQAAHQFLTYTIPTPLQTAVAFALRNFGVEFIAQFRAEYLARRDFLVSALTDVGFDVAVPKGTYFILADFTPVFEGDDWEFARWLTKEHGVAAIPPSSFFQADAVEGRRLARFAFCKRMETLEAAVERLGRITR
ncbi:MAG: aminotransferase class I/II-fold pyridoxal phosphate-dependent enzyme [Longimicrobiales bacterium]|nr:aminotransferase class I/II-fold pyridoxal phosphate-dependent enzyme [Longimicrobiales bacterium]